MVVRGPGQEEKIRQTPRMEGGEAHGVERERNRAKRRRRGPRPTGGSVVCRWRVLPTDSLNYKQTLVIEHPSRIPIVFSSLQFFL